MLFNFTFEGNIASEPELRFAKDGTPVCNLVVMRTGRFQRDGKWVDGRTVAINVSFWRGLAERAVDLNKGDTVIVEIADDLHGESFNGRIYLRATGRNLALSMRWHGATSHKQARPAQDGAVEVVSAGGYDTGASGGYESGSVEPTDGDASAPPAETTASGKPTRTRKPGLATVRP